MYGFSYILSIIQVLCTLLIQKLDEVQSQIFQDYYRSQKNSLRYVSLLGKNCSYLNSHKKFQNHFPNILYCKTAKLQFLPLEINISGEGRQNLRFGQYISHFFCLRCTCFIALWLNYAWDEKICSSLFYHEDSLFRISLLKLFIFKS